jgi:NitT/TauT family transport system permease protein
MFIRLPIALPFIVASTKVGFTLAVLGAVVAEFMMPNEGLGREILMAHSQYNINVIYLCVFFLIIQGLAVYALISVFETRLRNARKTED